MPGNKPAPKDSSYTKERMNMTVTHLRVETLEAPLGIDRTAPRFSWRMQASRQGARQVAYQILVSAPGGSTSEITADPDAALLWDSGRVESTLSHHIPYQGRRLVSGQRLEWRVRVWDERGEMAESQPAVFEMGLLKQSDWKARWIGGDLVGGRHASIPCPYLRKSFLIDKPLSSARLYITALGVYDAFMNGQRIGTDTLNPGWTDYSKRIHYHTYDVTAQLQGGENVLCAVLADGWYCGHLGWYGRQHYGDRPRLLAQLALAYADGTSALVLSDGTWRLAYGPLLSADLLMGESYDARLEFPGWNAPGFDPASWRPVTLFAAPPAALVAASAAPVRITREIKPVSVTRVDDWPNPRWVFDLGQNMVGRVRLKLLGKPGQTLTLRHAEALISDPPLSPFGTLYTIALRTAQATDRYTLKGQGEETWEPRFTFHGFRYVEVTGCDADPSLDMLTGLVLHSDLPWSGQFECSDPLLNRLQQNIQWSQRGNFVSIPTDCPQRDERLGWTGDLLAFAPTAAFNMDVQAFIAEWLHTLQDEQRQDGSIPAYAPDLGEMPEDGGPAWADVLIGVPWEMYTAYGDRHLLEEMYPACQKFIAWLVENSPGFIRAASGWQGFGDWLSTAETPKALIGTAWFAHSVDLIARIAGVLGQADDVAHYQSLFHDVQQAFLRNFVLPGAILLNNTQTGYVLALAFNLLPSEFRGQAARNLADEIRRNHVRLSTGFVGTPHLLRALSENGFLDLAYALLMQKEYPSWLYPVSQGATTIWERWDGWRHDRGFQSWMMNSFNHYAYGAVGNWLYSVVAGIQADPQNPGYRHFYLRPQPGGGLTRARAELDCPYGKIVSEWRIEQSEFIWRIVIPPNTSATVTLPGSLDESTTTRMDAGEYELRRAYIS
jgi:alpha-L-rhamnosidase